MKILIADDHAVFRRGLRETLSEAFSKTVFGEARTAQETLDLVNRQDWDIIILDISMPGRSGLDILDDLRRARPKIPVLLLTMHPEQQFARRALKAGAARVSDQGQCSRRVERSHQEDRGRGTLRERHAG